MSKAAGILLLIAGIALALLSLLPIALLANAEEGTLDVARVISWLVIHAVAGLVGLVGGIRLLRHPDRSEARFIAFGAAGCAGVCVAFALGISGPQALVLYGALALTAAAAGVMTAVVDRRIGG